MTTQINIRMPERLFTAVKDYAEERGFSNVQDFIRETVREKVFDKAEINEEELMLVKTLLKASEEKNLYGTEEELFKKLRA